MTTTRSSTRTSTKASQRPPKRGNALPRHLSKADADAPALMVALAGDPVALPRGRHLPGRRKPVSIASPKAKRYVTALERAARAAVENLGGVDSVARAFAGHGLAVSILLAFGTRFVERHGRPHTHKPDKDNCEKMVLDCLSRAGALGGDDSRVSTGTTTKVWAREGMMTVIVRTVPPGATVSSAPKLAAPDWLRR